MKKFFLLLLGLMAFSLSSCSWFDSDPIEPQILGVGNIRFDGEHDLYVVQIDSITYVVEEVIERDRNPRSATSTQALPPVNGMEVTVFKSAKGVVCVSGNKNEEQIEELYHENYTFIYVVIAFLLFSSVAILLARIAANNKK